MGAGWVAAARRGRMRAAAGAAADESDAVPAGQRRLRARHPPDPDADAGTLHVLRTGKPELYERLTDEMLAAYSSTLRPRY